LYTPARELVDAYLYEIAKGYGVDWIPDPPAEIKAEGDKGIEALKKDAKDGSEGEDGSEDGPGDGQEREPALQVASLETETSRNTPSTYSASEDLPGPKLPTAPTHNAEGGKDKAERIEATKKGTEDEELAKRFEKLKNLR
jgi:vacuolar protein sorting-associated protein IST1